MIAFVRMLLNFWSKIGQKEAEQMRSSVESAQQSQACKKRSKNESQRKEDEDEDEDEGEEDEEIEGRKKERKRWKMKSTSRPEKPV